nr:hypothetical protein GCM10020185_05060 [Pseudomonas brassicacearum subsp. brassicacearum]
MPSASRKRHSPPYKWPCCCVSRHGGLEVEPAEFVRAAQDWTRPELDGYAVWVVEWTQTIYLGEEEWPWPNQPPGSLLWGFSPDTGSGSEGSYQPPEDMA